MLLLDIQRGMSMIGKLVVCGIGKPAPRVRGTVRGSCFAFDAKTCDCAIPITCDDRLHRSAVH
jgi:hypothetical protein